MDKRHRPSASVHPPLLRTAHLILPLLPPPALSQIAATCKALDQVAKSITASRTSDASRNFEKFPVPFVNPVDDRPYAYFVYTPVQVRARRGPVYQPWGHVSEPTTRPGRIGSDSGSETRQEPETRPEKFVARPGIIGSNPNPETRQEPVFQPVSCPRIRPREAQDRPEKLVARPELDVGLSGSIAGQETRPGPVAGYPGSDPKPRGFGVEGGVGCECERCGEDSECPCSMSNGFGLTMECGDGCECGNECGNRVTQNGVAARLKIVRSERKGWGLHADQAIRRGEFVCEYAGELVTIKEARIRQQAYDRLAASRRFSSSLLVVREHLPSGNACMRINIDATKIGNVARFINHSCDGGNLSTVLVRSVGSFLPRICFFASRDILDGEELTFSYGNTSLNPQGLLCHCGSSCCSGIMPSEST